MAASQRLTVKREEDGVEVWFLKNPPVNALSTGLLSELATSVDRLASDSQTRCVVLTGDGTYFSAGADLKEVGMIGIEHAPEVAAKGQALFERLACAPMPVIAAINGLAVGGGLELALACDLRVAGDSAKLGAPEAKFGLMPAYGGTQRLPRLVGPAKAKELIFTAAMIPAPEALRIGLVNKVVPSGQELRAARDLAHTIAQQSPKAVAAAKRTIREGAETTLADGLKLELDAFTQEVLPSEDLGEGIAAFLERRPPKFKGA